MCLPPCCTHVVVGIVLPLSWQLNGPPPSSVRPRSAFRQPFRPSTLSVLSANQFVRLTALAMVGEFGYVFHVQPGFMIS